MKTYFKYICLCFLAVGLYSCDKDEDDLGYVPAGANTALLDNEISVFDQNEELTIQLSSQGNEVQSVEIEGSEGNIIADATIADSTATFNTSALGELTAGEDIGISTVTTLANGQVLRQPFTIAVTDAITLGSAPATINFMDTTATALAFNTNTFNATIDDVTLFRSTNVDTTFMDTGIDLNVAGDSINLGEINYEELGVGIGDTIFYRFVAESGEFSQAVETQVAIQTQDFGSSTATTLSNDSTMAGYNLSSGVYVTETDSIPVEIMFMEPAGFETMEGIDFVEATVPDDMTAAEFSAGLDLFEAEMIYEEGTPMTSVDEVELGDVYIYKTTRDDAAYYGIITIGDVTIVNGEVVSFDLDYSEGTIMRE